jgi:hypothetical protein
MSDYHCYSASIPIFRLLVPPAFFFVQIPLDHVSLHPLPTLIVNQLCTLDTNTLFCLYLFSPFQIFPTRRGLEASRTPVLVAVGVSLLGFSGDQNNLFGWFPVLSRHVGVLSCSRL